MPSDVRCLIYTRISKDRAGDAHGVENQLADLEKRAAARGWTVVHRLSDNDIGVTRKDPTRAGRFRPGWDEALRLVDSRQVDVVLCWRWDRALREPLDLEFLIPRFDKAGVRFAEADGIIDLGTDSGRLAARILIAVAKAEQERKSERQKLANEAAAVHGKRRTGTPRPFGYQADHVTAEPAEKAAVEQACALLLGGGTLAGVLREWTAAGVRPVQSRVGVWRLQSVRTILMNPRIAWLSVYKGDIVGTGQWEPLVTEETWRAVHAILDDPARKPPRGVRTLLGGLALCPCGNAMSGMPSHTGHHIYRCLPVSRNRDWTGGHVARQAKPVEDFIVDVVIGGCPAPTPWTCSTPRKAARTCPRCGKKQQRSGRTWTSSPPTGHSAWSPARKCSPPPNAPATASTRSAPNSKKQPGRTSSHRSPPPATSQSCGRTWTCPASARSSRP